MAERRMFTKKVTDDDRFIALSASAQALYLHLSMNADDDGFCNQLSTAMFKAHASVQDLEALLERRYIYQFDDGVIVIKHWRMANALRKDRYTMTAFKEDLAILGIDENGAYTMSHEDDMVAKWLPDGCQVVATGKDSIDKDSIDKISIEKKRGGFVKPTIEEIKAYVIEKGYHFDPEAFFSFYESNGWKVGKNPMKSWQSACITWEKREDNSAPKGKKLSDMSNEKVTPLSPEERQKLKGVIRR